MMMEKDNDSNETPLECCHLYFKLSKLYPSSTSSKDMFSSPYIIISEGIRDGNGGSFTSYVIKFKVGF
jgi:hypothetical protein